MDRAESDTYDNTTRIPEEEQVIDFENDPIDIREEGQDELPSDLYSDESGRRVENAELDNTLDELVDMVNGRDFEGLSELLASDVEAGFLGETSREGVLDGFNDLLLRYPTLLLTRADLGEDPLVAVWVFDNEADRFDAFGYITVEMDDSGGSLIETIDYVDELPDSEDLVVEAPERSDLPEWDEWVELDED